MGVCGISAESQMRMTWFGNRVCKIGEFCNAAFGEACAAAGLMESVRCLVCVPN